MKMKIYIIKINNTTRMSYPIVTGPGLVSGIPGQISWIDIDLNGCDARFLSVCISHEKGTNRIPTVFTSKNNRLGAIHYTPSECETLRIDIKYTDTHISKSPFYVPIAHVSVPVTTPKPITLNVSPPSFLTEYPSEQALVDDAATHGGILFVTRRSDDHSLNYTRSDPPVSVRIPHDILDILSHGMPTKIEALLTGFGTQTTERRILALSMFITLGGDVNTQGGILLLTALEGPTEIVDFLFANGARIYNNDDELYLTPIIETSAVMRYRSALNSSFTKQANRESLIKHIASANYKNLVTDLLDPEYPRLHVFTNASSLSAGAVNVVADILSQCYIKNREITLKYRPTSTQLEVQLVMDYGILYGTSGTYVSDLQKSLYDATCARRAYTKHTENDNGKKLARLAKIDSILSDADVAASS